MTTQHICVPRIGVWPIDAKLNSRRQPHAKRSTTRRATSSVPTTRTQKFNRRPKDTYTSKSCSKFQNRRINNTKGQVSYTTFAVLQQYKDAGRMYNIHSTALEVPNPPVRVLPSFLRRLTFTVPELHAL
jgi:hypothetical protein